MQRLPGYAAAGIAALLLSGCATGYLLDNQVQSFSHLSAPAAAPITYRFERTPSQQADAAQAQLEAFADAALHNAGFRRDDAAPRYAVQVSARIQPMVSPHADPWDRWGWGWGAWGWGRRGGIGFGMPRMESPWYHREVNVIVRELASGKVVYETRAVNDGPWLDNTSVLPAMFTAALQGFPNPPQGPRRVDIQIGGEKKAAL
jgi:hypothetical protein